MDNLVKDAIVKKTDTGRPGCKKCGLFGHFTYQCRNDFEIINKQSQNYDIDVSSTSSDSDLEDLPAMGTSAFSTGPPLEQKKLEPVEATARPDCHKTDSDDEESHKRSRSKKRKKTKSRERNRSRSRSRSRSSHKSSHKSKKHKRKRSHSRTHHSSRSHHSSSSHKHKSRKRKYSSDS